MATEATVNDWPQHVLLCRRRLEGWGGAERVLIEQAASFVERGIRCTIVVFEIDAPLREQLPREADVIVLGERRYSDLAFFPDLLKLSRCLRRLRPDCVIAHQTMTDYLRWALLGTGTPYFQLKYTSPFYMAQDTTKYSFLYRSRFQKVRDSMPGYSEIDSRPRQAGFLRRLMNEFFAVRDWLGVRGARRVFTLTSQSQWEIGQLYRVPGIIWTPGTNHVARPSRNEAAVQSLRAQYGIGEGQPVILSVNRLEPRKRVHVLIEAFRLLLTDGARPKLVIVGEGEEQVALKRQVSEAGLAGDVQFAGFVSEELLPHHYHMCDVAVAIIWGSWALSVVEPLLYDKKLLISDEIPDLFEGVPNLFRAKPDPVAVAERLKLALSSPPGDSADILVQHLDWNHQTDELLAHMRSARNGDSPVVSLG